jgi:hypothetical protein
VPLKQLIAALRRRDAIGEQAFGFAHATGRLVSTAQYELRLDHKLERTLVLLFGSAAAARTHRAGSLPPQGDAERQVPASWRVQHRPAYDRGFGAAAGCADGSWWPRRRGSRITGADRAVEGGDGPVVRVGVAGRS